MKTQELNHKFRPWMKRIVIIGAGFGGLAAAKALRHAKAEIWVIDRANHNLFQPLLYQVATTVLSPSQVESPIRGLLKNQRNATVILGEVSGINKDAKFVYARSENHQDVAHPYDILVTATGVAHSYFGHDEFAEFAPGLKGLADAVHIRNKVLKAFEQAEAEDDPTQRQDCLTLVLVSSRSNWRRTCLIASSPCTDPFESTVPTNQPSGDTHRAGRHGAASLWELSLPNSPRPPSAGSNVLA
jgi:hypothetical protein